MIRFRCPRCSTVSPAESAAVFTCASCGYAYKAPSATVTSAPVAKSVTASTPPGAAPAPASKPTAAPTAKATPAPAPRPAPASSNGTPAFRKWFDAPGWLPNNAKEARNALIERLRGTGFKARRTVIISWSQKQLAVKSGLLTEIAIAIRPSRGDGNNGLQLRYGGSYRRFLVRATGVVVAWILAAPGRARLKDEVHPHLLQASAGSRPTS